MSVVQYDQVKIVIKQMANYQPILHVHYYYQGKLVQVKFTVESAKIQKFLRATIDEAKLKKVELNSNTVKLNYRNIGSIEIKDYNTLKNEPLFKEFDKQVVQRSVKNKEKAKTLSTVKNLKVNKKYELWSKVKKTATKVGAVVLLGATLTGALTTLERFLPFQQNKSKVETDGTDLEQVPATDIKHSTITLNGQEENQKVKVLFSQTDTPSKKTEEDTTTQQEITPSVDSPVVDNTTVESVDTPEKETISVEKENESPVSSTSQATEEVNNTNWFSAQLESIQNAMSDAIGLTTSEEKVTANQEISSVEESIVVNAEDTFVNKETTPVSESNTEHSKEESQEETKTTTDQVTMNSMETAQVPEQEVVTEAETPVVEQESSTSSSNTSTLEEERSAVKETIEKESISTQKTQESTSSSEEVSLSEETTSHLETTSALADSVNQKETTEANEIDSSIAEQPSTNVPEEPVEQEIVSEEKETESQTSIVTEEIKSETAPITEVDTSMETVMDSQSSVSSEAEEVTSQSEKMTPSSNSSIETSPEATGSSTSEALVSSQALSETEASSLNEVTLHQETVTQEEEEPQQELTVTSEVSTTSEGSATPTTLTYHEEVAVNDQNTIKSGYHYTTGNTTYPMSEEDFYKLVVIINAESNKTYEDALGVASVIANRIEDGGWGGNMPLEIATAQGQFAVWQNSSVRSAASAAASSGSFDNAEVVKAARDCFFGGIRNNDYVEFKSSGSPAYSSSGEKKYQIVSGGNKYHHLAENLNRVSQNQYSSIDTTMNLDQIYDSYGLNEEENNRSLSA